MEASTFIKEVNGIKCITEGFSIRKGFRELRHVVLVCDKEGNIKDKVTETEVVNNDEYDYKEINYVAFDKEDKYIDCRMTIYRNEDGTINTDTVYVGALLYSYGCDMGRDEYYLIPEDDKCITICGNADESMSLDYDYKKFDFDSIDSYEIFGKYANAVMTACNKILSRP